MCQEHSSTLVELHDCHVDSSSIEAGVVHGTLRVYNGNYIPIRESHFTCYLSKPCSWVGQAIDEVLVTMENFKFAAFRQRYLIDHHFSWCLSQE